MKLDKFIYSLGIRHIGQENAKLISEFLGNYSNFVKLKEQKNIEDLSNIDGIGETQITSLKNFFKNNLNLQVILSLSKVLIIEKNNIKKKGEYFLIKH